MEWYATILPRIHSFVPKKTIIEIGPGFGRWTKYLVNLCENLILVDISEKCIAACKVMFKDFKHVKYFVNDGKSLDMIPEESVDFVFSFDSLVHAEKDVMEAYLGQLSKKLKKDGAAFIHHSNFGEYKIYYKLLNSMPTAIRVKLEVLNLVHNYKHNRAPTMTASLFEQYAGRSGLRLISQELITWVDRHKLIDCFSVVVRKESELMRDKSVKKINKMFWKEISYFYELH